MGSGAGGRRARAILLGGFPSTRSLLGYVEFLFPPDCQSSSTNIALDHFPGSAAEHCSELLSVYLGVCESLLHETGSKGAE